MVRGEATIKPRLSALKERERSGPGFARPAQSKDSRLLFVLYQGSAFEPALSEVEGCSILPSVFDEQSTGRSHDKSSLQNLIDHPASSLVIMSINHFPKAGF
jgi:hypothetical protein